MRGKLHLGERVLVARRDAGLGGVEALSARTDQPGSHIVRLSVKTHLKVTGSLETSQEGGPVRTSGQLKLEGEQRNNALDEGVVVQSRREDGGHGNEVGWVARKCRESKRGSWVSTRGKRAAPAAVVFSHPHPCSYPSADHPWSVPVLLLFPDVSSARTAQRASAR